MRGGALVSLSILVLAGCMKTGPEAPPFPAEAAAALREGQALLAEGKDARAAFARAAQKFHESPDITSAGRALNRGNAAYLAGDLPNAIAQFRAGLMLDPDHATLRAHLAYARGQVQYPAHQRGRPEPDDWPPWLPRLGTLTWILLGALACSLAWVSGAFWWIQERTWLAALALGCVTLTGIAGYAWLALDRQRARDHGYPVVVIAAEEEYLRVGNGPSYPVHSELPTLHRGMEARLLHRRGDWMQIQFSSGEVGWTDASAILVQTTKR